MLHRIHAQEQVAEEGGTDLAEKNTDYHIHLLPNNTFLSARKYPFKHDYHKEYLKGQESQVANHVDEDVMNIPEERGFLFSSAVLAIAMVILICLMVGSVILWDFGAAPAFTD